MKWFYFYEVIFYDEIEDKEVKDYGFVQAESYPEVMQQISDWYGEDFIDEVQIKAIEEGDGPLTISHIKDVFKKRVNINE